MADMHACLLYMHVQVCLHYTHRHVQQLVDGHIILQDSLFEGQDALLCSLQLPVQICKLVSRAGRICMAFLMLHQLVLHCRDTQLSSVAIAADKLLSLLFIIMCSDAAVLSLHILQRCFCMIQAVANP